MARRLLELPRTGRLACCRQQDSLLGHYPHLENGPQVLETGLQRRRRVETRLDAPEQGGQRRNGRVHPRHGRRRKHQHRGGCNGNLLQRHRQRQHRVPFHLHGQRTVEQRDPAFGTQHRHEPLGRRRHGRQPAHRGSPITAEHRDGGVSAEPTPSRSIRTNKQRNAI